MTEWQKNGGQKNDERRDTNPKRQRLRAIRLTPSLRRGRPGGRSTCVPTSGRESGLYRRFSTCRQHARTSLFPTILLRTPKLSWFCDRLDLRQFAEPHINGSRRWPNGGYWPRIRPKTNICSYVHLLLARLPQGVRCWVRRRTKPFPGLPVLPPIRGWHPTSPPPTSPPNVARPTSAKQECRCEVADAFG